MLESLIPVVAEWTKEALTAARRREDRAVANLVADCGFIVAAMRRLDREFHRIYSPLLYFQPQMSDARREELSAELIALAHSNEIGPRMTGLAKRIRSSPIVRDKQLPRLIDELMNVVKGALLVPPWVADGVSDVQRLGTEWRTHEGPWDDEDEPLRLSLDEILRYIATAAMRAALVACGQTLKT